MDRTEPHPSRHSGRLLPPVTRYYFHLRDSTQLIPDEEGFELPNLHEARGEIWQAIEELLQENSDIASAAGGWQVDVSDSSGTVLLSFRLD